MEIILKNKHTLQLDDFLFKCCVGKNGLTNKKVEGDKKTPKGIFGLDKLYYRKDRIKKPETNFKCLEINQNMGWCHDLSYPKKYNRLIKIDNKVKCEKLKRQDHKYDLLIAVKYNFKEPIIGFGSAIFIHLTKDYKPTAGCIALSKKDFLIMLKLINKNTKLIIP